MTSFEEDFAGQNAGWAGGKGHISDEYLLRSLDAELPAGQAAAVQSHLEACWSCRARSGQLENAILNGIEYRNERLKRFFPLSNAARTRFVAVLRERASQLDRKSFLSVSSPWLLRLAGASALAALVGLAIWLLTQPSPVEAADILDRSIAAEKTTLADAGHVVYRVVMLEGCTAGQSQPAKPCRIEIWQNGLKALARRVYTDEGRLVAGEWLNSEGLRVIYHDARLSLVPTAPSGTLSEDFIWQHSLSAEGFANVAGDLDRITLEELPAAYVLRYKTGLTFGRPRLLNASLTLRRTDMHAVEQTLQVEQSDRIREYRFIETVYERKPAGEVAESLFTVDPGLVEPVVAIIPKPEPVFIPATLEQEVAVLGSLDGVNALVEEKLSLSRAPDRVLVLQGTVETRQRRDEILQALRPMLRSYLVRSNIAMPGREAGAAPRADVQRSPIPDVFPGVLELRAYFARTEDPEEGSRDDEVRLFAAEILQRSARIESEAAALSEICRRFSETDLRTMNASARLQLQDMIHGHALSLHGELQKMRLQLEPVFGGAALPDAQGEVVQIAAETDLGYAASRLLNTAKSIEAHVEQSFRSATEAEKGASVKSSQFWSSLGSAERYTNLIVQISREANP